MSNLAIGYKIFKNEPEHLQEESEVFFSTNIRVAVSNFEQDHMINKDKEAS